MLYKPWLHNYTVQIPDDWVSLPWHFKLQGGRGFSSPDNLAEVCFYVQNPNENSKKEGRTDFWQRVLDYDEERGVNVERMGDTTLDGEENTVCFLVTNQLYTRKMISAVHKDMEYQIHSWARDSRHIEPIETIIKSFRFK